MKLCQAADAPVIVDVEFKDKQSIKVSIPRMTLGDFVTWGQLVDQQFIDRLTKGLNNDQRIQYMLFYGPAPSNIHKLRSMLRTPEGIRQTMRRQLPRSKVIVEQGEDRKLTDEEIETLMGFPQEQLVELVEEIGSLNTEQPKQADDKGEQNPLEQKSNTESQP
jgi:hypothetical protein